jgi:hypothetical protein
MRQIVWSNPDKQWEGFKLTRHSLDPNKVAALSITERRQVDGKQEDTPTTLEEIFGRLKDRSIKVEEGSCRQNSPWMMRGRFLRGHLSANNC